MGGAILSEYRGAPNKQILTLTLSNPKELNALTTQMQLELYEKLVQAEADPTVRVVLVRGAGEKAFSSGGAMENLSEIQGPEAAEAMYRRGTAIRDTMLAMSKPIVAAVSGWCLGAGFEIALSCDLIYASDTARFGMIEIDNGLVPGWGGALRLPRRTNLIRAKELLLLGTRIGAKFAYDQGIINRVFHEGTLFRRVDEILDVLAEKPPLAMKGMKEILALGVLDTGFDDARKVEHDLCVKLMDTHDFREAVAAFHEKRKPEFNGT